MKPVASPPSPPRGRPRSEAAASHAAIMDAVCALLEEGSARDLTMEAVAKRAGVGKPTLYKWWPSKSALVLAVFHERFASQLEKPSGETAEQAIRRKVRRLIQNFHGLFGKVLADIIAEGQSEPALLRELHERHLRPSREATAAEITQAVAAGEFKAGTNPGLLIDAIFGAIYYRMLLRHAPLTERYGEELVDQVLQGVRTASREIRGADVNSALRGFDASPRSLSEAGMATAQVSTGPGASAPPP